MRLILLALLFSFGVLAQDSTGDLINDPSLSLRCKELIKQRNQKIIVKQKMKSLIKRNEKLMSRTPVNKKTTMSKLRLSYQELRNEIYLINIVIRSMEEDIVRKGCPGIRL